MRHDHQTCSVCIKRAQRAHEEHQAVKAALSALQERIKALAEEHAAFHLQSHEEWKADEGEQVEVKPDGRVSLVSPSGFRVMPSPFCDKCCYSWPCPTYLWATQSEKFKLVIQPIGQADKPREDT